MIRFFTLIAVMVLFGVLTASESAGKPPSTAQAAQLMDKYCFSCHGEKKQKGKIRLDTLTTLSGDAHSDLLNTMQEVIRFEEMPPEDEKQPTVAERKLIDDWLANELKAFGPSKLDDKLRQPDYGNRVDHEKLFSGAFKDLKGFTYDRRWLISEYIFDAQFNRILEHRPYLTVDGKRVAVIGSNNRSKPNLTNPFLLPRKDGVRYYTNETLNGGHLLTMMTNAKEAATHMIWLSTRNKNYVPAINDIMGLEWEHQRIITARENFLTHFIEQTLENIYQEKHQGLLPKFVRVDVSSTETKPGEETKKAAFHAANPGREELVIIYHSMRRHEKSARNDKQLIELCEKDWFNYGDNERAIAARVTFLNNYMTEWRGEIEKHKYAERNKPPVYKALNADEMAVITQTILKNRKPTDHYNVLINKCLSAWEEEFKQLRIKAGQPKGETIAALVDQLFVKILERSPTSDEARKYAALTQTYFESMGHQQVIEKLIQTLFLRSDFVYRYEFGHGKPDQYGRTMLSPRDASYALAYALTDSSPDKVLADAASSGKLNTKEDYQREVMRMLKNREQYYIIDEAVEQINHTASFTAMPIRELRFFRDYFGYPNMLAIFKDNKRFGGNYELSKSRLVGEADQLVEHILETDRNVFEQLLTTDKFYVYHSGDNVAMEESSKRIRTIYNHFKDLDWNNFTEADVAKHKDFIKETEMRGMGRSPKDDVRVLKTIMTSFTLRFDKGQAAAAPYDSFPAHGKSNASTRTGMQLRGPEVAKFYNIDLDNWNYPTVQPAPVEHRKGMLTHPAWLIAHAQNTETDPIIRGKWVLEKLLAGNVPDVPITVDAVVPEDPHKTMRQRVDAKTQDAYCWTCHKKMNPLGLPFEMYDDFGRYRTQERLEYPENLLKKLPDKGEQHLDLRDLYKTLPVDARGKLTGTGDDKLDGDVTNALDLIDRLARSTRVRQSIIRYAFRYFLGRNEMLSDSQTLIDADQAYVKSNGSFDAVIISLLTSDSFIYRKADEN